MGEQDKQQQPEELNQNQDPSSAPQEGQSDEELKQTDQSSSAPQDDNQSGETEDEYKKELDRLKQERDNYKEGLLNKKEEMKKMKEEKPELTNEQIEEFVDKKVQEQAQKIREDFESRQLESEIGNLTDNPNKKELIKHHYNNSINKSGDLKTDLRRALLITDEEKIFKENQELRESLSAKQSVSNSSQGSTAKRERAEEPANVSLTEAEQRILERTNARRRARGEQELSPQELFNK